MSTLQDRAVTSPEGRDVDPQTITISGYAVDECYGPGTTSVTDPADAGRPDARIGRPGAFPYTRGVHETMYRGRLWTMRQFAGMGSADDTNQRFKYLLANARGTAAKTGLSTAFDLPTLMGRDSDDPLSVGEVGRCGVAIATIDDMHRLYADIPIEEVTVSQTINGPAAVIWAMYLAMARQRGFDWTKLGPGHGQAAGLRLDQARRHHPERHPQGVPQPERVHLPARGVGQAGGGHHRVRHAVHAPVEHGLHQRLSHPRGRLLGDPGAGVHAAGRHGVRRGVSQAGPGRRRVRAAAQLLLQQPQRVLRGDLQAAGGAAHVGEGDA
jgi:hypothetical protein